ncbi:hypothetical protein QQM79_01145 [Marinobacteraceae bacterium S3BR75-40.1]
MSVKYEFHFNDEKVRGYEVDLDRADMEPIASGEHAEWTELTHCQCSNCPLARNQHKYCPAAVDMEHVIDEFRNEHAFQKVTVRVFTEGRIYEKHTGLEEGLRSLLGLIMATSRCPLLAELRPMAVHHMPFATSDEFILRSVSLYLLQQYFAKRSGDTPDWDLKGLVDRNKRLQLVNQALWQRIHSVCESDSNLKALLSFFSMASSVTFSLESQLQKLRSKLESGKA